ncbi:hypothetical protein [Kaarinaea lacus]
MSRQEDERMQSVHGQGMAMDESRGGKLIRTGSDEGGILGI